MLFAYRYLGKEGYEMTAHKLGDIGGVCSLDNLLNQLVATVCVDNLWGGFDSNPN